MDRARVTTAGQKPGQTVTRLRPLRVLLAMRDRRFMRVTAFLLERRGYAVVQEGGSNVVDAALRSHADVVVLEGEPSRGTSGRTLAALAALPIAPGLITVVGGSAEELAGVAAVAKWTPVDDLAREIDAVSLRRGMPLVQRSMQS
jgi:hypothetical protein